MALAAFASEEERLSLIDEGLAALPERRATSAYGWSAAATILVAAAFAALYAADALWFSRDVRHAVLAVSALEALQRKDCPKTRATMLRWIASDLEEHQVPYFVSYGTLLGAQRENNVIPWTADIDICVPSLIKESTRTVFSQMATCFDVEPYIDSDLFHLYSKAADVEVVSHGWLRRSTAYVDVYGAFGRGEAVTSEALLYLVGSHSARNPDGITLLESLVFPINASGVRIGDRSYAAPRDPEALLEIMYGKEWRTPDRGHSGSFRRRRAAAVRAR